MADILLSFGVSQTDGDVKDIRKGLESIITKIEQNPPKVRVGLTVDNDALNHFKKELEAILNTVSLANGAPITLNISGLGEISAQATQAKKSLDNLKKSGSGTGSDFAGRGDGTNLPAPGDHPGVEHSFHGTGFSGCSVG